MDRAAMNRQRQRVMPPSVRRDSKQQRIKRDGYIKGRDWFTDHYPSSFFSYYLYFYYMDRGYHTGMPKTTRHRNRSSDTATEMAQPQTQQRLQQQRIVTKSTEQGWYPIEMERNNNNTNIGKQQASTGNTGRRRGKLYLFGI